jgi:hypothetical protein
LAWMTVRFVTGQVRETIRVAEQLAKDATEAGDVQTAFVSTLMRSRSLFQIGRPDDAIKIMESVVAPTESEAVQRDAHMARAHVIAGRYAVGLALARETLVRTADVTPNAATEARSEIASVFALLGHLAEAKEALLDSEPSASGLSPLLHATLPFRIRALFLATRAGQLHEAAECIRGLDEGPLAGSLLGAYLRLHRAMMGILKGDLSGVQERVELTLAETEKSENAYMYQWAFFTRHILAMMRNEPTLPTEWSQKVAPPMGPQSEAIKALQRMHAIRFGYDAECGDDDDVADSLAVELAILKEMGQAEHAIIVGDKEQAMSKALMAVTRSREWGLKVSEAESLAILCDGLLMSERYDDVIRTAEELLSLSRSMPSDRFEAHGVLALMLGDSDQPDPLRLAQLAAGRNICPAVADRALMLLGAQDPVHRLDAAILKAAKTRWSSVDMTPFGPLPSGDKGAVWSIDLNRRQICLPGGRVVDLSRHGLFVRFLTEIANGGGACDKELLAEAVWEVGEYHPLNDDKRIRVAVRRLRNLLEDEPSSPVRLVTTEDGYAFGDTEFCVVIQPRMA